MFLSPQVLTTLADASYLKAPARGTVSYTLKIISVLCNDTTNAFSNGLSNELDHAWYNLLQSKWQQKKLPPLPGGGVRQESNG